MLFIDLNHYVKALHWHSGKYWLIWHIPRIAQVQLLGVLLGYYVGCLGSITYDQGVLWWSFMLYTDLNHYAGALHWHSGKYWLIWHIL